METWYLSLILARQSKPTWVTIKWCISGMVYRSDFSARGYMLYSQHQHGHSESSVTSIRGNLIPSSGILRHKIIKHFNGVIFYLIFLKIKVCFYKLKYFLLKWQHMFLIYYFLLLLFVSILKSITLILLWFKLLRWIKIASVVIFTEVF